MNRVELPTQGLFYKYRLGNHQWLSTDGINTNYANVIYDTEGVFNWGTPVYVVPSNGIYNISGQIVYYSATSHTVGPHETTLPPNTTLK